MRGEIDVADLSRDGWTSVGEVGVDSGLIWIGDPCYVKGGPMQNWAAFCARLGDHATSFGNDGVAVSSGYGDGGYQVYVKHGPEDRVAAAMIVFIAKDDEEADD